MRFVLTSAFSFLVICGGLPFGVSAQTTASKAPRTTASTPDPKKVPVIEEIFRQTKPEGMISNLLGNYKAAFQQAATNGFETEVRKFDDPAKYRSDFTKVEDRVFALLNSRLDWQKMKPQFVQVYSDTFTLDELSGMAAFYRSPAGHAFLEKMPGVLQKVGQISQQQVAPIGPDIQKIMTDFLADVKRRSAAASPKPPAK